MPETKNSDSEIIIAQNKEEWSRLLFLLQDPEPNVLWINCDTAFLKKPLHDAITEHFPQLAPYDIYLNEQTESLNKIIFGEDKDKIPPNSIIHVFGIEDAVKSADFRGNLNFQRDTLFRKTPAHLIIWADFATGTVLTHKAYDFWSWVVFTFDFRTPEQLLTARQKGFKKELILENAKIELPHRDSSARIRHLEDEWEEFLRSVNGKPSTVKQMRDAVAIALALAQEYDEEGRWGESSALLKRVLSAKTELLSIREMGQVYIDLAGSLRQIGKYNEVIQFLENLLNKENFEKNQYAKAAIQSGLALAYMDIGEYEKARELLEQALQAAIQTFGKRHQEVATMSMNLASVYTYLNRYRDAQTLFEEALEIDRKIFGNDHPIVSRILSNLATVHADVGNYEIAKKMLEESINSDVINLGEFHPDIAVKYTNIADVYHSLGDLNTAKKYYQNAIEIGLRNFDEKHPSIGIRHNNLAILYFDMKDYTNAKKHMQIAYDIFKLSHDENSGKVQDTLNFLKNLETNEPR